MSDRERPTLRPPPTVPRPRARQSSNHDSEGGLSSNERELILQAIQTATAQATKQVKADLEARIAQQSQRAPAPKKHDWGDIATKFVAALALIGTTLGALKPTKDERVDKAYEELAKAVKTIETQQQRTDGSVESLRAWLAGFNATGVKVTSAPGAPPAAQVELLPAPMQRGTRRGQAEAAPAIQVRTPLPAPPPSSAPIKLAPKLTP